MSLRLKLKTKEGSQQVGITGPCQVYDCFEEKQEPMSRMASLLEFKQILDGIVSESFRS